MARQGKAGIQVNMKKNHVELSFWGSVNGVSQRLATRKLQIATPEEIASVANEEITRLRTAAGK